MSLLIQQHSKPVITIWPHMQLPASLGCTSVSTTGVVIPVPWLQPDHLCDPCTGPASGLLWSGFCWCPGREKMLLVDDYLKRSSVLKMQLHIQTEDFRLHKREAFWIFAAEWNERYRVPAECLPGCWFSWKYLLSDHHLHSHCPCSRPVRVCGGLHAPETCVRASCRMSPTHWMCPWFRTNQQKVATEIGWPGEYDD